MLDFEKCRHDMEIRYRRRQRQSNITNRKRTMWKSLFIAGASIWTLSAHAATLSMQRVDTGMQVRTDAGVLTIARGAL